MLKSHPQLLLAVPLQSLKKLAQKGYPAVSHLCSGEMSLEKQSCGAAPLANQNQLANFPLPSPLLPEPLFQ